MTVVMVRVIVSFVHFMVMMRMVLVVMIKVQVTMRMIVMVIIVVMVMFEELTSVLGVTDAALPGWRDELFGLGCFGLLCE